MNEAIKLAIEKGGYIPKIQWLIGEHKYSRLILLEPSFWQALGKALGWNSTVNIRWAADISRDVPEWEYEALRYHELVLTGGDTEKFWKELVAEQI